MKVSPTYTLPELSTATPLGEKKSAIVPTPSKYPPIALPPASVMTVLFGKMARMQWLPESATYTFPEESTATPAGNLNFAEVPTPFMKPCELPASVVTSLLREMRRMRLFVASDTIKLPDMSTAMPVGCQKRAEVPFPSAEPCVVPPANVATVLFGKMTRMQLLLVSDTSVEGGCGTKCACVCEGRRIIAVPH